jgi:hypothetical protein
MLYAFWKLFLGDVESGARKKFLGARRMGSVSVEFSETQTN